MSTAILHQPNCAQPGGIDIMIVLIDKSRHTFNLPDDLNYDTEFIAKQDCPNS